MRDTKLWLLTLEGYTFGNDKMLRFEVYLTCFSHITSLRASIGMKGLTLGGVILCCIAV